MNFSNNILAGIATGVLLGSLLAGSAFKARTTLAGTTPELPAVDISSPDFSEAAIACDHATSACVDKYTLPQINEERRTLRQLTANSEKRTSNHDDVVLVTYGAGVSGDSGFVAVNLDSGSDALGSGWTRGINYSGYHGVGSNSIVTGSANAARQSVSIVNTPGTFIPSGNGPSGIPASIAPAGAAPVKTPVTLAVAPASAPNTISPTKTMPRERDHARHDHKRKPRRLVPSLLPDFVPHFTRMTPSDIQTAVGSTAFEVVATAPAGDVPAATVVRDTPLAVEALFAALNELAPTGGPADSNQASAAITLAPLAIPAPTSIILLMLGLAALGWSRVRRS